MQVLEETAYWFEFVGESEVMNPEWLSELQQQATN